MTKITIARLNTIEGKLPAPPNPAWMVFGDGRPLLHISQDEGESAIVEYFQRHVAKHCSQCGGTIMPGSQYIAGFDDGDGLKFCAACIHDPEDIAVIRLSSEGCALKWVDGHIEFAEVIERLTKSMPKCERRVAGVPR